MFFLLKRSFNYWIAQSCISNHRDNKITDIHFTVAVKQKQNPIYTKIVVVLEDGYSVVPKNSRISPMSEGSNCIHTNQ